MNSNNFKKRKLAAAVLMTTLTFTGAAAVASPDSSVERNRGVASGLVIGAIAGGPAGAFFGSVLGGEVFGRLFEQRRVNKALTDEVIALRSSLNDEQQRYIVTTGALNQDLDKLVSIQSVQNKQRKLPVQFRTGSSVIEPQYEDELKNIARLLSRNKDASVTLAGFADRRGENQANFRLSEQRVDGVKDFLVSQGASTSQILTTAYGETRPLSTEESLENNFFDRRVVIELNLDIDPQLATR